MRDTWEGREIEVDFFFGDDEWCAMELRVLGIPVEITEDLMWRLNELAGELG